MFKEPLSLQTPIHSNAHDSLANDHTRSLSEVLHLNIMQMHDPKANSTRSSSTISASSSAVKLGYHGGGANNGQVTSSASNKASGSSGSNSNNSANSSNNSTNSKAADHRRGKKKTTRDRQQPTKDDKPASAMSNLSSYSLIDDDHIDDQETINVGNLIIDLESDLEKEKIESEQANNNVLESNSKYSNSSAKNAPSSTSQLATSAPSSSTPSLSIATSTPSTPNKISTVNKSDPSQSEQNKSNTKQANNQKYSTKKDTVTNNAANSSSPGNNGHNVLSRTVFKSSADERGELKMKITRETKPGKNEHKIVTSPDHKSPTSSSGGLAGNLKQDTSPYEHGPAPTQGTSGISSTRECGTSTSIGTITEPECLGPCEPGTSVTLEGIVWQETDGGILVVNVTWRGKTYVGALLDCTRHDMNWAPPRLCDSPASDIDAKTSKGNRAKRIVTRSNGIGLDEKNLLQTTGKLRNGKGRRIPTSNEPASCNKKQRDTSDKPTGESSTAQIDTNAQQADNMASTISENPCPLVSMDTSSSIINNNSNNQLESPQEPGNSLLDKTGPESPTLIGCNEPNCNKKYRNMNGLLYHQSHAHSAENESSSNQDDCSSSLKDKETKGSDDYTTPDARLSPRQSAMQIDSPPDHLAQEGRTDPRQHFMPHQQVQKRERSPSPDVSSKFNKTLTDPMHSFSSPYPGVGPRDHPRPRLNDSPRITAVKNVNQERRNSSSPSQIGSAPKGLDHGHKSSSVNQKHHSYDLQGQSSSSSNPQVTIQSSSTSSKSSSHSSKQANPQPPLPAPTEEGMKPSGTSTGPPPAPHQANCYFNPAFLANTFNPYALPPYFPRHMYDPLTPPNIPTSNAAFLTRFMNNMRVPPPPDSPSRLLSPSMPKNVPFPPFKPDSGAIPPQIPTSHPLPNLSPMTNPNMPPMPLPPLPPLSMANIPPNIRMPSPSDPIMPPSSQPPPFPGLNPMMGIPGMPGNPLRPPMGGPPVPNLVDDPLAKHLPRRF